jgi:hypothetical protein
MTSRDDSETTRNDALGAYRDAAHAEADGYFDERALEAQRQRILARLEQAGHRAKVLPFPGAPATVRMGTSSSRRWVSAAAAAGLLVGLLTGQLLHVMPGDNWVHPDRRLPMGQPPSSARLTAVPAVAKASFEADDALLDAIDAAVTRHAVTDLRPFDDLTFNEPD